MTKTIIIGEQKESEPEKKKIELLQAVGINSSGELVSSKTANKAERWSFAELICKDYLTGRDLIFCYSNPEERSRGILYVGKWNDGVA